MTDDSKKRNILTILFFLAILFVAIGFDHGNQVSGQYTRQSASSPETWKMDCRIPTVSAAGKDLGRTLFNTFGCQRGQTVILCDNAVKGLQLGKGVTAEISCASSNDKQQFVLACRDQITALCTPSVRTTTRR